MGATNLDAVSVEIKVAGEVCDFETMELYQSICTHHHFKIVVNYKPDMPSLWAVGQDAVFKQLGQKVSITMTHNESGEKTEFYGLISDINARGFDGNQGYVILEGGSPTILMDRDPAMDCYVEQTLSAIVDDVKKMSGINLSVTNSPKHGGAIPYVGRYKETSYGFLARLLFSYGEWFYYNGEKLIVGNPNITKETPTAYDVDLTEVNIKASVRALNSSVYDFDPVEGKSHYEKWNKAEGVTVGSKTADGCSKPLYPTEATLPSVRAVHSGKDIENYGNAEYNRSYSQLSQFEGKSRNCAIRLGELIVANIPEGFSGVTVSDLGRYRVIEIHHTVDREGRYTNSFKGIPGMTPVMPWGEVTMPIAYPEMAKVTNNDDPKKQGRVKVQFMWQEKTGKESDWMRVQSPDAGKSDKVSQNRGFVFIPEEEDLVMVGFEQGNPDRPFVMGSLFYKDNAKGAESNNKIKTITTRSGVAIIFDDDEGEGAITISDPSGSTIVLGGDKTISISAPESISISAKEITINGEDKVEIKSKEIIGDASETMNLTGKQSVSIKSNTEIKQEAPQVSTEGKTAVNVKGANVTIEGTAITTIKGTASLNLN